MRTKIRGKNFPPQAKEIILNAGIELRHHPDRKNEILEEARGRLERVGFQPPQRRSESGDLLFGKILGPDRKQLVETAFQVQKIKLLGKGGVNIVNLLQEVLSGLFITERVAYEKGYLSFLENDEKKIFLNTCKKLIKLPSHPNVVQFLEYGKKMNGDVAFIFEYAPGKNLKSFLIEEQPTFADFIQIAIKGLRAINHLHRHKMIHCDVKPTNFCVHPSDRSIEVNLIDLDFSRNYQNYIRDIKLKKIPGTIRFLPGEVVFPEKVPTSGPLQEKMAFGYDTYAFGLTLYYMLTQGYPPEFQPDDSKLVLIRKANKFIKKEPIYLPLPESRPKEFHQALEIIRHMVHSDWSCRPPYPILTSWLNDLKATDEPLFPPSRAKPFPVKARVKGPTDSIGEYKVVNRKSDIIYAFPDGTKVALALLKDKRNLSFLGIPNEFTNRKDARSFFKKRSQFLSSLNIIREKYRDLFPGEYNIVLEFGKTNHTVWTIRPFLDGAITLSQFILAAPHKLTPETRANILIRIARSLSALSEAGYVHPNLSMETIFLIPPYHHLNDKSELVQESMIIDANSTIETLSTPLPDFLEGKVSLNQLDLPHTLELMDLNNSHPPVPGQSDPNLPKFIAIAKYLLSNIYESEGYYAHLLNELEELIKAQANWSKVSAFLLENGRPKKG